MKIWKLTLKETKSLNARRRKRRLKIDSFLHRVDTAAKASNKTIGNGENETNDKMNPPLDLSEERGGETQCQDNSQTKEKSVAVKNVNQKRTSKRHPLSQKNILLMAEKKRTINCRRDEKDELERQRYLKQKKVAIQKKKSMQEALFRAREGIKLAKYHFSLSLLRRYMCWYWGGLITEMRLKHQKV